MGTTYKVAVGVKVWDGGGISLKKFMVLNKALELVAYHNRFGLRLTGLYEIHNTVKGFAGLKWYAGPGTHMSFYDYKGYYGDKAIAGVDGVIGFDYKINKVPINFSLDWQPSFEFADNRGLALDWGGFAVRYTF